MRLHQTLLLASSLMAIMPTFTFSSPVNSWHSTGRNYDRLDDSVELFREKAGQEGITNLRIHWPTLNDANYLWIRTHLNTWIGKGKRHMFIHWLDDGSALKALVALPRTPTWNGWLNRNVGEVDYGVMTILPGSGPILAEHMDGIIKVKPLDVNQLDNWFNSHAQTLADLRATRF